MAAVAGPRGGLAEIGGFKVLPVKVAADSAVRRYVYFKKHQPKAEDGSAPPDSSSLFVINISVDCTEELVKAVFGVSGTVASVVFGHHADTPSASSPASIFSVEDNRKFGTRHCIVRYANERSVEKALSLPLAGWQDPVLPADDDLWNKWLEQYRRARPDPVVLQQEVDEFMLEHDRRKEKERREKEAASELPDAEGFVLVQRRGRKAVSDGNVHVTGVRAADVKQKEEKPLTDFYRFQKREGKRDHLVQLQKKFEEDKKRIARFKANRTFKPY